jgi:hypothetical protein
VAGGQPYRAAARDLMGAGWRNADGRIAQVILETPV